MMTRHFIALTVFSLVVGFASPACGAAPYDLLSLNPASPNYAQIFNGVKIGDSVPQAETFKAGDEILLATCAYLCPTSPVVGNTGYRDRLFVLLDHRFGLWAAGNQLGDIGCIWQAAYAYLMMKRHRPVDISAERVSLYETALARNQTATLTGNPLLYNQGLLANLWLNGDIRLAMSLYFGALALGDNAIAEKARAAIDNVASIAGLDDGGTRYVGFWGEVASYHDESVRAFIYWWKITGSVPIKAAIDASLRYAIVSNEPSGFVEQSSNIPYKHMYNNLHSTRSSLWKAYLYNDGYNYYFGAAEETAGSTELLNVILYQPSRVTRTPPSHVGVFWDGNIQGPRGRFNGNWGWIAHGRDVQNGGPESRSLIQSQGYDGRQCGKNTFVGAYALGPVADKTSLKGALDTMLVEFKQTQGEETDLMRGSKYRYLAQDEHTATITRNHFGTLSTTYRISSRTSSNASPDWNAGATPWLGQQLWVLTGERVIGLVQIVSDADSTVYGLDARLVFTGGRRGIMGRYLDLLQPEATSFAFGDLRAKIHATNFTGAITQQRIAISDPASTDDYSALVRIHDAAVNADAPISYPAGTRRWIVIDFVRDGTGYAAPVYNVLSGNATWAVLQFHEGTRKVRIVQNLTAAEHNYSGNFVIGSTYAQTTLHRSWNDAITPLTATSGTAVVADVVPAYGHMIAVNSAQPDDHTATTRTSADVFGAAAYLNTLKDYALGTSSPLVSPIPDSGSQLALTFSRRRADVDYTVEASSDLASWTPIATNPGTVGETVTVTDLLEPANPGLPRRFLRMRLTVPPP